MHEVEIAISRTRFRCALRSAEASGLLPIDHDQILSMDLADVKARTERLVCIMLAPQVRWVEERDISCSIRLTEDDLTFVFVFEQFADAVLFGIRWSPEAAEVAPEEQSD